MEHIHSGLLFVINMVRKDLRHITLTKNKKEAHGFLFIFGAGDRT